MSEQEQEFTTTFAMDFTIADHFGVKAVRDTYNRAFSEWKTDYRYLTELVLVLNHKIWEHFYTGNSALSRQYDILWRKAHQYALSHLKGAEFQYYWEKTD